MVKDNILENLQCRLDREAIDQLRLEVVRMNSELDEAHRRVIETEFLLKKIKLEHESWRGNVFEMINNMYEEDTI